MSAPAPASGCEGNTPCRLTEPVFRRCQQLAADLAWRHCLPALRLPGDVADRVDPGGRLSAKKRGTFGLVLIGSLGYARVGSVLGIRPCDMAPLLRAALLKQGTSPAAVEDGSQVRGLPQASHESGRPSAQERRLPRNERRRCRRSWIR